jgi:hypothetical protein
MKYWFKFNFDSFNSCISDLEVAKETPLFVEFVDMDIETKDRKKCRQDYMRIKGANKTKFYCGELKKEKIREMGPWGKDYRLQFSFRSNNDGNRGRGGLLYLYTA